jgi:hypothetical protein
MSNISNNAGKAVEKLSRSCGNARKRKQEREAECKQKRADTSGREYLGSKKACIYISMRSGVKTYGCMYSNGRSDARKGCEVEP